MTCLLSTGIAEPLPSLPGSLGQKSLTFPTVHVAQDGSHEPADPPFWFSGTAIRRGLCLSPGGPTSLLRCRSYPEYDREADLVGSWLVLGSEVGEGPGDADYVVRAARRYPAKLHRPL